MKLRELAVAVAALSLAGTAMAAGNNTNSTTTNREPAARQGQTLAQSTASQQGRSSQPSSASGQGTQSSGMSSSNGASQSGILASEEHNPQFVREVQQALKQKGYDVGAIDGQMGPNTENALRQFQQAQGIQQTGNLDQQTLSALGVNENGQASASSGNMSGTTSSQNHASSTQNSAYK